MEGAVMATFTLPGFAAHLTNLMASTLVANHHALEVAAQIVEKEAKAEIGTYQAAAGPFKAWDHLSSATLEGFLHPVAGWIPGKETLGYAPPDNPLLRTGDMRDSIEHVVHVVSLTGGEAHVGSNDDKALWQELGTPNALYPIEPRSFLGGAAFRKKGEIGRATGHSMVMHLSGLGTNKTTKV
jgi:hypothetical protein